MTLEKSNRGLVDELSFVYVRKGYRSRVRWLLYWLADWADKEEQLAGLEPDKRHHWYTHLVFSPWQEERYNYFELLLAFVRTAMQRGLKAERGGKRALKALKRANQVLIRLLTESPFAGRYAPDEGVYPGKDYCGTYRKRILKAQDKESKGHQKELYYLSDPIVVDHSHRRSGCYVWHEAWQTTGKSRGWIAWSELFSIEGWGRTPALAVKACLTCIRHEKLADQKARSGTFSERELARMTGRQLREVCKKRGLPASRRLDDMRTQLRTGQKSLMSLLK